MRYTYKMNEFSNQNKMMMEMLKEMTKKKEENPNKPKSNYFRINIAARQNINNK